MSWYRKAEDVPAAPAGDSEDSCPNITGYLSVTEQMRRGMPRPEGWAYGSPDDFIRKHGIKFRSAPLTEEEKLVVAKFLKRKGFYKPKQCHYNAQEIAKSSPGMQLVEGYVFPALIPIYHSWNSVNGKVVDFTLRKEDQPIIGVIPEGWEYFGVPMPTEQASRMWAEQGTAGPIIDNWETGYPMLKEEYKGIPPKKASTEVWGRIEDYRGEYGLV